MIKLKTTQLVAKLGLEDAVDNWKAEREYEYEEGDEAFEHVGCQAFDLLGVDELVEGVVKDAGEADSQASNQLERSEDLYWACIEQYCFFKWLCLPLQVVLILPDLVVHRIELQVDLIDALM